jgi:hypothetical protein
VRRRNRLTVAALFQVTTPLARRTRTVRRQPELSRLVGESLGLTEWQHELEMRPFRRPG